MISVSARVLGRKAAPPWFSAPPPDLGSPSVPLRCLLAHVVRQEAAAFRERQEKRALLEVLTPEEIAERAARGRVARGWAAPVATGAGVEVDEELAVEVALQAFEDGIYLVILDGIERERLDEDVTLRPDSTLVFLRLVMLAGG